MYLRHYIGRHVDRHSADMSIESDLGGRYVGLFRSPLDRHAVDTRLLSHRRLADALPTFDRYCNDTWSSLVSLLKLLLFALPTALSTSTYARLRQHHATLDLSHALITCKSGQHFEGNSELLL